MSLKGVNNEAPSSSVIGRVYYRLCMSPLHVSISTDPLASFVMYMLSHSSR